MPHKPRVLFLIDRRRWAFDFIAQAIADRLSTKYSFIFGYTGEGFRPGDMRFDLVYVFYWRDQSYIAAGIPSDKVIKEVASFRWREENFSRKTGFEALSCERFAEIYLQGVSVVTTPARSLFDELAPYCGELFLCPNGFEPALFRYRRDRYKNYKGLHVGWVGNPEDPCKGLSDVVVPACDGVELEATSGGWSRAKVSNLYSRCDVLAVASTAESQPLPLIEGMASGCFPVCTNVGIVSQLVSHGYNGLIVDRSIEAFRNAFAWCNANLTHVRRMGQFNAHYMRVVRDWDQCASRFDEIFTYVLSKQEGGVSLCRPNSNETHHGPMGILPPTAKDWESGFALMRLKRRLLLQARDLSAAWISLFMEMKWRGVVRTMGSRLPAKARNALKRWARFR